MLNVAKDLTACSLSSGKKRNGTSCKTNPTMIFLLRVGVRMMEVHSKLNRWFFMKLIEQQPLSVMFWEKVIWWFGYRSNGTGGALW